MDNYTTAEQRKAFLSEVAELIEQNKNNPDAQGKVLLNAGEVAPATETDFFKKDSATYEDLGSLSLTEIIKGAVDDNEVSSQDNARFSKKVDIAGFREKNFSENNNDTKNKPV